MARPSKLTVTQCDRIRALKTDPENPVPAPTLAKRFKVSESSIYKVLDGSYVARADDGNRKQPTQVATRVPPCRPTGATPSIFRPQLNHSMRRHTDIAPVDHHTLAELLENVAKADTGPVDELTLAAAELVIARAKLSRMLSAA